MVAPILVQIGDGTAEWGKHTYIGYADGGVNVPQNEWFMNQVPASVLEAFTAVVNALNNGEVTISTAYGASTEEIDAMKALASNN